MSHGTQGIFVVALVMGTMAAVGSGRLDEIILAAGMVIGTLYCVYLCIRMSKW